MGFLSTLFTIDGRLSPRDFSVAVLVVYVGAALTHGLLAGPIVARLSIVPFAVAHLACSWAWCAIHAKRLRDAGRSAGPALALTIIYVLALAVLLGMMAFFLWWQPASELGSAPMSNMLGFYLMIYLVAILAGMANPSGFGLFVIGLLVLLFGPVLLALGFSVWTGTRQPPPEHPLSR